MWGPNVSLELLGASERSDRTVTRLSFRLRVEKSRHDDLLRARTTSGDGKSNSSSALSGVGTSTKGVDVIGVVGVDTGVALDDAAILSYWLNGWVC